MVGLAIGLGGVAALALGAVADAVGLETALTRCARSPPATVLILFLPPATRASGAAVSGARGLRGRSGTLAPPTAELTRRNAMTVQEFFEALPTKADPAKMAGMTNSYVFDVDGVGQRTVAVEDGTVTVTEGAGDADYTIPASEETLLKIAPGEANPTTAYMTGKLKIAGDMGAALKLQKLF